MKVSIKLPDLDKVDRELARLELMVRGKTLKKALRRGGQVVQKRARELCPRSIQTGTWDAWSKSTEAARQGVKPLAETIGVVVREYDRGTFVLLVGPEYPAGALGHLIEYGHAEVLWGQTTGRRVPPHPFLRPAADETQEQVSAAIIDTLRAEATL